MLARKFAGLSGRSYLNDRIESATCPRSHLTIGSGRPGAASRRRLLWGAI